MATLPLTGRTVAVTADRRGEEQAELLRRRGADVVLAPTIRTVDLTGDPDLRARTRALVVEPPELLVVTTGSGFRAWLDAAAAWGWRDQLLRSLAARTEVVCRGAKGVSAVRGAGLRAAWRAEAETMREVVDHLAGRPAPARAVLQLFDPDDHWATGALRAWCPGLVELPLYRWLPPADPGSVTRLVDRVVAGGVDAVTFTSQPAVRNLFALAGDRRDALRAAFDPGPVAAVCVGAVCAEALVESGVGTAVWPDPPRLVAMVRLTEEVFARHPERG